MNRRSFFTMFAGVVAALPFVRKLVRHQPTWYFVSDPNAYLWIDPPPMIGTSIEYRDGKRLRIMHGWRTVRHYNHTTGVITDGVELT